MNLSTDYMGLTLRNPLVASASPLSQTVDGVRRLADAGVGAVVLYSLFEEQLRREAAENARLVDAGTESFAESLSYFPAAAEDEAGPRRYLSLLERAAAAVDVPVIGSLNGVTPGGWADYARAMQDAGAAAIELNIYYLPGDPRISGRDVEQRHVDILTRVKDAVSVPVAVKLSPYFSSTGEMALRLDEAGADALVLFNRFLQPDIDPETLAVVPQVGLSSPAEARLPRTWIALLHGRVRASLAATTGVETSADVAKYLLAGADVVMTASALLRHGPEHATVLLDGLVGLDGTQGIRGRRRAARDARRAARHRRGGLRASGLRRRAAGGQQRHLRALMNEACGRGTRARPLARTVPGRGARPHAATPAATVSARELRRGNLRRVRRLPWRRGARHRGSLLHATRARQRDRLTRARGRDRRRQPPKHRAVLTTPLKASQGALATAPWSEDAHGQRTVWLNREGIAERMLHAVHEEKARRAHRRAARPTG